MSLHEKIKDMPLFKYFTNNEMKTFSQMEHLVQSFEKDQSIIGEGEESTSLYLLVEGNVEVTKKVDDVSIRLAKLKPGELFGEMSFFSKKLRSSNVVAKDPVSVLRMDDEFFLKIDPGIRDKIKNFLIELLIKRLDNMNDAIMRVSKLMRA